MKIDNVSLIGFVICLVFIASAVDTPVMVKSGGGGEWKISQTK